MECKKTVVKIHWVLGHIGIEGNRKADEAAEKASEKAGTRRCLE